MAADEIEHALGGNRKLARAGTECRRPHIWFSQTGAAALWGRVVPSPKGSLWRGGCDCAVGLPLRRFDGGCQQRVLLGSCVNRRGRGSDTAGSSGAAQIDLGGDGSRSSGSWNSPPEGGGGLAAAAAAASAAARRRRANCAARRVDHLTGFPAFISFCRRESTCSGPAGLVGLSCTE